MGGRSTAEGGQRVHWEDGRGLAGHPTTSTPRKHQGFVSAGRLGSWMWVPLTLAALSVLGWPLAIWGGRKRSWFGVWNAQDYFGEGGAACQDAQRFSASRHPEPYRAPHQPAEHLRPKQDKPCIGLTCCSRPCCTNRPACRGAATPSCVVLFWCVSTTFYSIVPAPALAHVADRGVGRVTLPG